MKEYYVEVYFPPFQGRKVRVFSNEQVRVFSNEQVRDCLLPDLIALYRVKALDCDDALALALTGKASTMISPDAKQVRFA